ncbi:MAG: acyl-CoA dehydrogenase family protein [Acidimicrobiales bacterium]
MDLIYPAEVEVFRAEVRSWLEAHLPPLWFEPGFTLGGAGRAAFNRSWVRALHEGGWICASWPREFGGRGLTVMESVVLAEEFARVKAPMRADFFGDTLVGPTILQWGTEAQKADLLPLIQAGQVSWCQGFSEPDAGSDLASLSTRAVLDGDEWVINGQKIWTTQAQTADYIFLLARTDPDAPRHKGISFLLVPMRQPGIEVRPIVQPDGSAEFNETFLTDARCPRENVVGGVNNGWAVAMTTLGFERGSSATTSHRRFAKELAVIVAAAQANGTAVDPVIRQRLAVAWSKVKIMEINGLRSLTALLHPDLSAAQRHAAAALGATTKMFWSEYHRETMELAMDILGMAGQILTGGADEESIPEVQRGRGRDDYPVSPLQASFFFSRSETIWGGTAEIQRNIVGERVLALPKEPRMSPPISQMEA